MPTYNFLNQKTKTEWSEFMTISELEEFLVKNPDVQTVFTKAPPLIRSTGTLQPTGGMKEMLHRIKKSNKGSTIQTGNLSMI